jgi:RNA polymerase sigma-70 factor (ECF subfamily)
MSDPGLPTLPTTPAPGLPPQSPAPAPAQGPGTVARFATTQWTVVLSASRDRSDTTHARQALEELCRTYWRPIYAFVRRLGHPPHDSQDLTQEFFARLLATDSLDRVSPAKGRFRTFLLAALKHFLANEWDKLRTQKRGGRLTFVPIDAPDTEAGTPPDPASPGPGPDQAFDRQWALALLERVLARLQEEHQAAGRRALFESLKDTLTRDRQGLPYATVASQLGMTEGAVKVAVHRLRLRYRELLRLEIAATVENPGDVETELRELFRALAG